MPAPSLDDAITYLSGSGITSWPDEQVEAALAAEQAAQARVVRLPVDPAPWPANLTEALLRRVAGNLARRKIPLGVLTGELESLRISGTDSEVARLEAGCRRWVVG